jgi:hypothetical protein
VLFLDKSGSLSKNIAIFAKNSAHIERRFKINAYLCIVADNPSQT